MNGKVRIVRIHNPLQPSAGREELDLDYQPGRGLRGYLIDARLDSDEFTVSVNGRTLSLPEQELALPQPGHCVVVSPRLAGGSLFRTLGSIAVMIAAAAVASTGIGAALSIGLLGLSGTTALAVANAIAAGVVTIGGNILVNAIANALFPPNRQSSPSYDPDGPKSLAQSGTPVPKGYGTFNWGGNVIDGFTDVEGQNQYVNVLLCYGHGPARSITDIEINGKSIGDYGNVSYFLRYGTNNQAPIPTFGQIVNGYPQNTQCLAGKPIIVPGTGTLTQALQVDVSFPSGLWVLTNDGNLIPAVITYTVEYAVSGSGNWQPVLQPLQTQDITQYHVDGTAYSPWTWALVATDQPPSSGIVYVVDNGPHTAGDPGSTQQTVETFQANGNHSTYTRTFYGEWQPVDVLINQVLVLSWTDGYQDFSACSQQPQYNRTSIYGLAPNKYDVRITKYGSNRLHDDVGFGDNFSPNIGQDMWVHNVNEITYQTLSYPNMILIGVRALATGQLSGAQLNVTATITHGLRTLDNNVLPAALQIFEEDNPACVAADMLLDGLYGGGQWPGVLPANIQRYIDEWVAWAQLNDELVDDGNGNSIRRHVFNGVFDAQDDLWNALKVVGKMSRAAIIPIGRDYGVYLDAPDVPVQIFSSGNVVTDSFSETWLELDARANQVEIEFADATRYWRQDNPLVYMDPAFQNAGVAIKNTRVNAKGVTLPAQAWHLARYLERSNQFLLRSGSFRCDTDAIAARPGNVIILQNDVPQWGWGGRTLPGSTASTIYLDRSDVAFVANTSYSFIVLHAAVLRYSGSVTGVSVLTDTTGEPAGTQIAVSNFNNANRVTRAVVAGTDCLILSAQAGSVVLQLPVGFTPASGQAYQLYDTDVLETAPVAAVALGSPVPDGQPLQVLTLATPLLQPPDDFAVYFYGPAGTQKLARAVQITRASEFRSQIQWVDYDPAVFVDATPNVGETSALVSTSPGVSSLQATETYLKQGGSYIPQVILSWALGPNTAGVSIYVTYPSSGLSVSNALPQLLIRLSGQPTSYTVPQVAPGQQIAFTVVGFDINDNYASFTKAPTATLTPAGIAKNLLLGSSFQTGFTYWNLASRAGDTLAYSLNDDGESTYTVAGSALTQAMAWIFQEVSPSSWTAGQSLMLSAYLMDTAVNSSTPDSGYLTATLVFRDAGGNQTYARAPLTMSGVSPSLTRVNTPSAVIPAGTARIFVWIGVDGDSTHPLNVPVGAVLTASHLLLEVASPSQTVPSTWADIDAQGQIEDLFTTGSSSGLRVQGSVVPSFTGQFSYTQNATDVTISWSNLVILWPDSMYSYIQNGSIDVTGLSPSTSYFAYPYYDVMNAQVAFIFPSASAGNPAILTTHADAFSDAATRSDGRVALAAGGLSVTTVATGTSGTRGTGGGGTGTGGSGGDPIGGPSTPDLPGQDDFN